MAKLWTALEVEVEVGDTVPVNVLSAALQSGIGQMKRGIQEALGNGIPPGSVKISMEQPVVVMLDGALACRGRS